MYMKTEIEQLRKEFNERIDAILKEDKPKFEINKWYKNNSTKTLFYLIKLSGEERQYGYGFGYDGTWYDLDESEKYWNESVAIIATHEEVKAALVNEAEKKYEVGDKVKCLNDKIERILSEYDLKNPSYERDIEGGFNLGTSTIMLNGQWATIIKDDVIKVGGYEVKFEGDGNKRCTSIDGNIFTERFWQSARIISEHSKAKIMIGCSQQFDVSLETINKILDKL